MAPPRRRLATRDVQILDAAAALFSQRGFADVGVDEIGTRAGVTGPAIYRHFKGKDEILATLCDNALDQLFILTGTESEDPWDEIQALVSGHAAMMVDHHALAGVWIREGRLLSDTFRNRIYRRQRTYIDRWIEAVHRCLPHRPTEELTTLTFASVGALNSMATWPRAALQGDPVGLITAAITDGLRSLAQEHDRSARQSPVAP
jgi:AcrR family transcriptional regulator